MLEIDFLAVGDKSNTGDAITVRVTRADGLGEAVIVIDGGFVETGSRVAAHVRTYYGTDVVDLMICTHPDDDHIRGLFDVIEELNVKRLLIHRPNLYGYGSEADDSKSDLVEELVAAATARGTAIDNQFSGFEYFGGTIKLLGPSESFYVEQLKVQSAGETVTNRLVKMLASAAFTLKKVFRSDDPGETMKSDNGGTTPRNNSSIITSIKADGHRALLTGDAGVPGLTPAVEALEAAGETAGTLSFFDVPHHGSRHNLNPQLLDRILGAPNGGTRRGSAFVSIGKEADEHPRPDVANAIKRRGYPICETRGQNIWWHINSPERADYSSIEPLGWMSEV